MKVKKNIFISGSLHDDFISVGTGNAFCGF